MNNIKRKESPLTFKTASRISHKTNSKDLTFGSNTNLWKLIGIIAVGGLVFRNVYELSGLTQSLHLEEYTSNAALITAQRNAKQAKARGEPSRSQLDEFMMNIPEIQPDKGYYIKTPSGHHAQYYENDQGEPFLIDDAQNLWIWAGADIDNGIDDWLVRTPAGDIYNYYMNNKGELQQKVLGNERDIKMISDTNLGTVIGFRNTEVSDLQYRELPPNSLETQYDQKTGLKTLLAPSILEEGLVETRDRNSFLPGSLPFFESYAPRENNTTVGSVHSNEEKSQLEPDPFFSPIDFEDQALIDLLQKEGRIDSTVAKQLKLELAIETNP